MELFQSGRFRFAVDQKGQEQIGDGDFAGATAQKTRTAGQVLDVQGGEGGAEVAERLDQDIEERG